MPIPTLTTERLKLRPFSTNDAESLWRILDQPNVLRYFPRQTSPTLEQVQRLVAAQLTHWQNFGYGWWAVILTKTNHFIGWAGLQYLPDTDEIEVAYLLDPAHWGRGLATEAAMKSLDFGYGELNIPQIVAIVHPENGASIRVIEKLGMTFTCRTTYFGMDCFRYELDQANFRQLGQQPAI